MQVLPCVEFSKRKILIPELRCHNPCVFRFVASNALPCSGKIRWRLEAEKSQTKKVEIRTSARRTIGFYSPLRNKHKKKEAGKPEANKPFGPQDLDWPGELKLVRDMLRSLNAIGNAEVKARLASHDRELVKFEKRLKTEVYVQTKPPFDVDTLTDTKNSRAYGFRVFDEAITDFETNINNRIPSYGTSRGAGSRQETIVRPRQDVSTLRKRSMDQFVGITHR